MQMTGVRRGKAWVEKHMADAEREAVMDPYSPIAVDVEIRQSWGG